MVKYKCPRCRRLGVVYASIEYQGKRQVRVYCGACDDIYIVGEVSKQVRLEDEV